jgi:hypothetical protein
MEEIKMKINDDIELALAAKDMIIRTGAAPIIENPIAFTVTSITPESLVEYIDKRTECKSNGLYNYINPADSVVFVEKAKRFIMLKIGQHTGQGESVSSKIDINPNIQGVFKIVPEQGFSAEMTEREVIDILRRNKRFIRGGDNALILSKLMSFTAERTTKIKQEDNRRGNVDFQMKSDAVSNAHGLTFMLDMPVLRGGSKIIFNVEIVPNVEEGRATFFFEAIDLPDLINVEGDTRIDEAVKQIRIVAPELPILFS